MSMTKRAAARSTGLALAARVATVSGLAVAAFGLAEARLASASEPKVTSAASDGRKPLSVVTSAASDDTKPLPMEGWVKTQGGCGCAPCWGPPAPPRKRSARARRRARGAR